MDLNFETVLRRVKRLRNPPPPYLNRHPGRSFVIILTGPSVRQYSKKISSFIDQKKALTMGCNNALEQFSLDYHLFMNGRRFLDYGKKADPNATLLLSPDFKMKTIRKAIGTRNYETISIRNQYPSQTGDLSVNPRGRIQSKGATAGPVAMGVALAMGAQEIFVAGMDGYKKSKETHYYHEKDDKTWDALMQVQTCDAGILQAVAREMEKEGKKLNIITPTVHEKFYDPHLLEETS